MSLSISETLEARSRVEGIMAQLYYFPFDAYQREYIKASGLGAAHGSPHRRVGAQPITGDELRAVKRYLAVREARLPWLFISERGQPFTRLALRIHLAGPAGEQTEVCLNDLTDSVQPSFGLNANSDSSNPAMGCTSASRRGGPAWGSGGVTTLTVRAFGIGSDCSFHRVYVADFTTFWIASPFCAERRAPVQAAFIGRQLLFTASHWAHPHFQSGHYGGRLSEQPAPSGRIEARSPFVLARI